MLYYRDSLALSVFALILTALLRKMQEMNIEVPYWISTTTSFVLSNRAGRFLILTENDSKLSSNQGILGEETENNSEVSKSRAKESAWRHFAAIIEWLSFFIVIFTYVVILITLVPSTWKIHSPHVLLRDSSSVIDCRFSFSINNNLINDAFFLFFLISYR